MSANTTPDATATNEEFERMFKLARTLERELAAAKAEIARVTADFDRVTSTLYDRVNDVIALKDRAERAEAQLRERTQWQCKCGGTDCAGQAENQQLRAEVERLKLPVSLSEAANRPTDTVSVIHQYDAFACCQQLDQLRARVAELEAHIVNLLPCANMLLRNEQPMAAYADTLPYVIADAQAAIDAARAGKGAT